MDIKKEGYRFAQEVYSGKWNHVGGLDNKSGCPAFVEELQSRCPGHTENQYKDALSNGFYAAK
ncbi:MAG: hypothetical protein COA90_02990 [Gammaproteobacteria bacterium]|nr:MAG: hypothetical protein COA90_02990 [Gammaproteobacteria bacterium]